MVATCESAVLPEKLIAATAAKQGITRGQLTIHADRGSSMTSKPVALLLADRRHPVPQPPARQQRQPLLPPQ
jgi:putative transposase